MARIGHTDYPLEVDDLLAERAPHDTLSHAAAAGCALVASSSSDVALLFSIPDGSSADPLPLALPSAPLAPHPHDAPTNNPYSHLPHPPALAIWPLDPSGPPTLVGAALLSRAAVLRVYPSLVIRERDSADRDHERERGRLDRPRSHPRSTPPVQEIRLAATLAASLSPNHPPVSAHAVLPLLPAYPALLVFGARGAAALVDLSGSALSARPLARPAPAPPPRASARIAGLLSSAFRGLRGSVIGGGPGGGGSLADEANGTGPHAVIAALPVGQRGALVVRRSGAIERWTLTNLAWSAHVMDFPTSAPTPTMALHDGSIETTVLAAGITSDGTLALLVSRRELDASPDDRLDKSLIALDVRDVREPPPEILLELSLGDSAAADDPDCTMVVSGDIVYVYTPSTGDLAWRSIARGVPPEGQVQGTHTATPTSDVIGFVDATHAIAKSSPAGDGVAACLHATGIMLTSFDVPPTLSRDPGLAGAGFRTAEDAIPAFRRAFLQYEAAQPGAARATLAGLVDDLAANAFSITEVFSAVVLKVSHEIVSCAFDQGKQLVTMLVNSELDKRRAQHKSLVRMLADPSIFTQIRPDPPSLAEDRIWDAIEVPVRSAVLAHSEKIATAIGIRNLENVESSRFHTGGFNEAASIATDGDNALLKVARDLRQTKPGENGPSPLDNVNLVSMALRAAGDASSRVDGMSDVGDEDSGDADEKYALTLYQDPIMFHHFLPALERCMSKVFADLKSRRNGSGLKSSEDATLYTQAARSVVSTVCEAVVVVVHKSMEARATNSEKVTGSFFGMQGVSNWLHNSDACYTVLMKIAKDALSVGAECPQAERGSVMKLATAVLDNMLSCAQLQQSPGRSSRARNAQRTTSNKRRRVDLEYENTEWGKLVGSAMELLIHHNLDDEAFQLAEKYEDFNTMMMLRHRAPSFDAFMERALDTFGDDFGLYAFRWLEDRSHLGLLLRGRPTVPDDSMRDDEVQTVMCRTHRTHAALSKYFAELRPRTSNLEWIHAMRVYDWAAGYDGARAQLDRTNVVGKENSLPNSLLLSSVVKLMSVASKDDPSLGPHVEAQRTSVEAIHSLAEVQDVVDGSNNAVASGVSLVRGIMEDGEPDSAHIAKQAGLALRVVRDCATLGRDGGDETKFVWRHCMERQADAWSELAKHWASLTDVELRARLVGTALFMAAKQHGLSARSFDEMVEAGMLSSGAFDDSEQHVPKLARTAVELVADAAA